MNKKYLLFMILLLIVSSLACSWLDGGSSEPALMDPTSEPATPTLAPTSPAQPTLPAEDLGGTEEAVGNSDGQVDGTVTGSEVEATPGSGVETPAANGNGGDGGSGDGGSDDGNGDSVSPVAACPASGQNLLLNSSFEGQYKPFGAFTELNHAPNWFPWWKDGENNLRPEFKPADVATAPNRVHSGNNAQQYFKSYGQFKAGLYQSVLNVPVGSRLQFSAYGQAWSCEEFDLCPNGTSVNPADMLMRVGIDPTGDTNYEASTVVWSDYFNPLDQWQVSCVSAVAERDIVTVFLWASPNGPRENQDVFWDDASLIVIP
jgi:hypothetical protein